MKAVTCPRCNARQNVDKNRPNFECWQCKTHIAIAPVRANASGKREDWREWLGKD
jgi:hypothetical protein